MNITVEIKAPELAKAIESLAAALSGSQLASNQAVFEKAIEKQVSKPAPAPKPKKLAEKVDEALENLSEKEEVSKEPEIKLETVRTKLAQLSQSGKQAQVKELISSFGAKKLTDVPADKYADLLAAAEEIA